MTVAEKAVAVWGQVGKQGAALGGRMKDCCDGNPFFVAAGRADCYTRENDRF